MFRRYNVSVSFSGDDVADRPGPSRRFQQTTDEDR